MNPNSTNSHDVRISALFIKECRKFIAALNDNCSMQELSELRQRIVQIRLKQQQQDQSKNGLAG